LAALGFTVNLGPVVDFDDPANPAIGMFGRAYGTDPDLIAAYAAAFVDGFASAGVICALKHFPGHGNSAGDSHDGVADISATWTDAELRPFAHLIAAGRAPMVMGGHLRMTVLEPSGLPITFSAAVMTGLLRDRLGYRGVVVTDDLDMDAVRRLMGRRQAVVEAIRNGNDLLMIKNLEDYDPLLPQRVVRWVRAAIADGTLRETQVIEAAGRVRSLRQGNGKHTRSL
jgi:beta-N-acetylhexosaminidase